MLKRFLVTAPLVAALAIVGIAGTAQAATPAKAAAQITGICTIYSNGAPMWTFVSTESACIWTAADLQQSAPGSYISYTWYPLA